MKHETITGIDRAQDVRHMILLMIALAFASVGLTGIIWAFICHTLDAIVGSVGTLLIFVILCHMRSREDSLTSGLSIICWVSCFILSLLVVLGNTGITALCDASWTRWLAVTIFTLCIAFIYLPHMRTLYTEWHRRP